MPGKVLIVATLGLAGVVSAAGEPANATTGVAVLVVGVFRSFLVEEVRQSFKTHVLGALEGRRPTTFLCVDPPSAEELDVIPSLGPSVETDYRKFVYKTRRSRATSCYLRARDFEDQRRVIFTHFILVRPDLRWFADLPSIALLCNDAVSARARAYYDPRPPNALRIEGWNSLGYGAYTDDHLSFGWGQAEPGCAANLLLSKTCPFDKSHPCVILDDQVGIVPRSRAHAYFGFYNEDKDVQARMMRRQPPDEWKGPAWLWGRACGPADHVTQRCYKGQCGVGYAGGEKHLTTHLVSQSIPMTVIPLRVRVDLRDTRSPTGFRGSAMLPTVKGSKGTVIDTASPIWKNCFLEPCNSTNHSCDSLSSPAQSTVPRPSVPQTCGNSTASTTLSLPSLAPCLVRELRRANFAMPGSRHYHPEMNATSTYVITREAHIRRRMILMRHLANISLPPEKYVLGMDRSVFSVEAARCLTNQATSTLPLNDWQGHAKLGLAPCGHKKTLVCSAEGTCEAPALTPAHSSATPTDARVRRKLAPPKRKQVRGTRRAKPSNKWGATPHTVAVSAAHAAVWYDLASDKKKSWALVIEDDVIFKVPTGADNTTQVLLEMVRDTDGDFDLIFVGALCSVLPLSDVRDTELVRRHLQIPTSSSTCSFMASCWQMAKKVT